MADSELRRTHPLTVAVRTVGTLGQAIVGFIWLAAIAVIGKGGLAFLGAAVLVVVAAMVIAGVSWLNWAFFRYGIVGDDLLIHEGWLYKKQRSIPLARIQGVDVRAKLMSRLFGLADVMIQTAGGGTGEAEARIGAIPLHEAEALRADLIVGRRSSAAEATRPADADTIFGADPIGRLSDFRGALGGTERPEVALLAEYKASLWQLVIAALTSNGPLIAVAAVVGFASQIFEFAGSGGTDTAGQLARSASIPLLIVFGLLALLMIGGIAVAVTVSRDFGFAVRRTQDRLETEAGLLERRMTSVPVRRIQAVIIEATWPRRILGLQSARVNTAGFGKSEDQQSTTSSALVPIARTAEMHDVLARLLPEAVPFPFTVPVPHRALRFYLLLPTLGVALLTLVLTAVPLAIFTMTGISDGLAIIGPLIVTLAVVIASAAVAGARTLAWRASGFGVSGDALAIEYGALGRYAVRVGRSRIQSLAISQSFFQRRAGLATLHVVSVSGSAAARFHVRHMPAEDAARIGSWYSPDAARNETRGVADPASAT